MITKNEKPYCSDHLDLVERTDALIDEVNKRRREIAAVLGAGEEGWRLVDLEGSVAKDILGALEVYGAQTLQGLSRFVQLKAAIVQPYVKAMLEKKLIRTKYARADRGFAQVVYR